MSDPDTRPTSENAPRPSDVARRRVFRTDPDSPTPQTLHGAPGRPAALSHLAPWTPVRDAIPRRFSRRLESANLAERLGLLGMTALSLYELSCFGWLDVMKIRGMGWTGMRAVVHALGSAGLRLRNAPRDPDWLCRHPTDQVDWPRSIDRWLRSGRTDPLPLAKEIEREHSRTESPWKRLEDA